MPGSQVAIVVAIFVVVDLMVIPIIIRAIVLTTWGQLEKAFPGCPPAADAVSREFQSLRIGSSNFGGCVHVAVDERWLHLFPARFIRWFGAGQVSIPWDHIDEVRAVRRSKLVSARAGAVRIAAPAWAMELCGGVSERDARG